MKRTWQILHLALQEDVENKHNGCQGDTHANSAS